MTAPARRGPVDPRLLRYARSSRGFLALSAVITLAQTACIIAFAWLVTALVTGVIDRGVDERFAPQLGAQRAARGGQQHGHRNGRGRQDNRPHHAQRNDVVAQLRIDDPTQSVSDIALRGKRSGHIDIVPGKALLS